MPDRLKDPARSPDDYRGRAADVRRMAATSRFDDIRGALLRLADTLDDLADGAEDRVSSG